jgi:hypothetical protein
MVQSIVHLQFTEILRGSPFYNIYLSFLGVQVDTDAYIEGMSMPDFDLVSIGARSVVGPHVLLNAHSYEAPYLTRQKVVIGRNCVLMPTSATLPEFTMENGATLECLNVGLKGMVLGRRDSLD